MGGDSGIEDKRTQYGTPLRMKDNLFYLDLWVKLPEQLADDLIRRATFARRAN